MHTQRTLAARTLSPGRAHSVVLQASSALSLARPAVSRALPHVSQPPAPYRGALLRRIAALAALYRDTTVAPQPRYNVLYHDTPWPSHASARAVVRPAHRPAVSWLVSWPYHAGSWAWPGRVVAPAAMLSCPVSRYNPLYRDSNGQ